MPLATIMNVEKVKYVIWAADSNRCAKFYLDVFQGHLVKQSPHITEIEICGNIIGIHGGGKGERTWTGMSFQVADVVQGASEVVVAGGKLSREPEPENGEPPHLAMCVDTEGNEIMLTRKR